MWTRIAAHYPIAYENAVLAEYRSHSANATSQTFDSGVALSTHRLLLDVTDAYLPEPLRCRRNANRRREHARFIIASGRRRAHWTQRWQHARHALALSRSPQVLRETASLLIRRSA